MTIAGLDGSRRDLFLGYDREPDPEARYRQGIASWQARGAASPEGFAEMFATAKVLTALR